MNTSNAIVLVLLVAGAGLAVWALSRDSSASGSVVGGLFGPPAEAQRNPTGAEDAATVIGAVGGAVGSVLGGIGGLVGSLGTAAGNASSGRAAK